MNEPDPLRRAVVIARGLTTYTHVPGESTYTMSRPAEPDPHERLRAYLAARTDLSDNAKVDRGSKDSPTFGDLRDVLAASDNPLAARGIV